MALFHVSWPEMPKHGHITLFFVEIPSKLIHPVLFEEVLFTFRLSYHTSDFKKLHFFCGFSASFDSGGAREGLGGDDDIPPSEQI